MKKLALISLAFLMLSTVRAQDADQVGWISKFGFAGGFTPMWVIPNFEPLNTVLPNFGVEKFSTSGFVAYGGGGYAYLMFIENVRIGGFGYGGSLNQKANVGGADKEVEYILNSGAFTIEYTLPFIEGVAVSIGAMLGGGTQELKIYSNNSNFTWDGVWNEVSSNGAASNISRTIQNDFFTVTPTLTLDVPLNRFMAFRIGTGYQFSFADEWTIENRKTLNNVPSDLNGDAFFIQTGLYFGLFAF
ncbi:MAG: hypothetical protein KKG93_05695 [Bacteroidetes bacterium]|nr:hypothetical protein [Bacteroidota bacterium]